MINNQDLLADTLKAMDDGVDCIARTIFLLGIDDPCGEHPDYPRADWRHEIIEDNTSLGYWHWVTHQLVNQEEDDNDD